MISGANYGNTGVFLYIIMAFQEDCDIYNHIWAQAWLFAWRSAAHFTKLISSAWILWANHRIVGRGLRDGMSFSWATCNNNRLFFSMGLGPWVWMLAVYSAAAGIQLTQANNRREETPFPLALWSSFTNMKTVELQPHSIVITMSSGQTVTTNKKRKNKLTIWN